MLLIKMSTWSTFWVLHSRRKQVLVEFQVQCPEYSHDQIFLLNVLRLSIPSHIVLAWAIASCQLLHEDLKMNADCFRTTVLWKQLAFLPRSAVTGVVSCSPRRLSGQNPLISIVLNTIRWMLGEMSWCEGLGRPYCRLRPESTPSRTILQALFRSFSISSAKTAPIAPFRDRHHDDSKRYTYDSDGDPPLEVSTSPHSKFGRSHSITTLGFPHKSFTLGALRRPRNRRNTSRPPWVTAQLRNADVF